MDIAVGDTIQTRKKHPCGASSFEVLRVGMDFKIRCTGCGRCAALCPERTISLVSGRPVWQGECTRCLACLHRCPAGAIQYGRGTEKRERYVNPKVMF